MGDNLNNSLGKDILNDIIDETGGLVNKIKRFILSNKNWIFYFLNPLVNSDANKSIENIVKEFPDEWEDYIDLEINNISQSNIEVKIEIDEGYEYPTELKRYIYLPTFLDSVERNKKLYEGNFKDIKINNLKEDIERCKEYLVNKEKELNELLKEKITNN